MKKRKTNNKKDLKEKKRTLINENTKRKKEKIKSKKLNKKGPQLKVGIFTASLILIVLIYLLGEYYLFSFVIRPKNNEIFVNKNNNYWAENGSKKYPFKGLKKAIEFTNKNSNFKNIKIEKGIYLGGVTLPRGVNLLGMGEETIIDLPYDLISEQDIYLSFTKNDPVAAVIIMSGNNKIDNIQIQNGCFGIFFLSDSGGSINNCKIRNAKKYNIYNQEFSEINNEKIIQIKNSHISKSGKQCIYLTKSIAEIQNSIITECAEEGIDLHSYMKTLIKGNTILNNGEGGIETEIGNNELIIENNTIKGNKSSGINLQSEDINSKVIIKNNIVKNNTDHGLRCVTHASTVPKYFTKAFVDDLEIIKSENEFVDNGSDNVASRCKK